MEKDEEPRFVQLLQPNRDLAANWTVDVAWELERYLAGLSLVAISDEEGQDSFNFAEAALLIQGSIQVYSRKVEYLYALVLQALDFIANKKQAQRENSSIQANGKDADIIEDQEEDFLNLDDVPEETNIDIVDEQNRSSCITPAIRPPACLLVVEGDNVDISGEAGELAFYQISTSSLHRDFLLLDPCDAKFVDEYWKDNARSKVKGTPAHSSNPVGQISPNSRAMTPIPNGCVDAGVSGTCQRTCSVQGTPGPIDAHTDDGADDWHDDDGGGGTWGDATNDADQNNNNNNAATAHEKAYDRSAHSLNEVNEHDDREDSVPDPWTPLNPHEPGTLPVVPYKRGRPCRRKRVKKVSESLVDSAVSELGKVWQALESLEREAWRAEQSEEPPPYEKLRSSFIAKRASGIGAIWSSDKSDKGSDSEDSRSYEDRYEGVDEPDTYEPDVVEDFGSQDPSQPMSHDTEHIHENDAEKEVSQASYLKDLCQAQLDAVLKKHAEAEKLSEIANRVVSWNKKIEKHLAIQDARPAFDIHAYGERILDKLSSTDHNDPGLIEVEKTFTYIVGGLEKHDVARTFAALLQLVNNGNVMLTTGEAKVPDCFTAENPFGVKLLSCRKQHEEMLQYRAPSSRPRKNSVRKKEKGMPSWAPMLNENTVGSCRLGLGGEVIVSVTPASHFKKGRRLSEGIGWSEVEKDGMGSFSKVSISPKSNTPEGKRRRRRQSLKPVQVRLAG